LFAEKAKERGKGSSQKKLSPEQLRALEAEKEKETLRGYARAQELWPRVVADPPGEDQADAEREWFFEIERLVEMFRETRRLFQTSKVPDTSDEMRVADLCLGPFPRYVQPLTQETDRK
jgi:general transcription factor 3C polypeptide 3 (transcription factor C subunit 4)